MGQRAINMFMPFDVISPSDLKWTVDNLNLYLKAITGWMRANKVKLNLDEM